MPDDKREVLKARLAWARKTINDPWRVLRKLELGFTVEHVADDTAILQRLVDALERELDGPGDLSDRLAKITRAMIAARS